MNIGASAVCLTFGPSVMTLQQGISGVVIPITMETLNDGGIAMLEDLEHLQITIHTSSRTCSASHLAVLPLSLRVFLAHLTSMNRLGLSYFPLLRSLTFHIVFDTINDACVIHAWAGTFTVVCTIPEASQLEHLTLSSPVPRAIMRSAWSSSTLVRALERPPYSLDRCLVALVDRAPLRVITLVAPQGEQFMSSDWVRARSFFRALWDYGMLEF
ncbi:uncharacterized protein PHACADRAFT_179805 [Phanerochaete carnosa HHB-10118-sp]|uniref:Uncharacterized protein n=1 Tax=Phanerochaete carnosa (strain HHB-10118-sp) TaxID=650164 RepID=K5W9C8_PHACS|nr:uncharacterized protein PHACADRAFT_179805 [Phanerochaete carnosa HHB-10118-sp]EKM60563.1 hypothetical protein PHACADRAFT_179805 [Phanerochaete carnosa HHB-10118-sp]